MEFTPCNHSNPKIQKIILLCIFFVSLSQPFVARKKFPRYHCYGSISAPSGSERINLIQQLEQEDKQALFRIIDSMLTKTKFKDFVDKNMASL